MTNKSTTTTTETEALLKRFPGLESCGCCYSAHGLVAVQKVTLSPDPAGADEAPNRAKKRTPGALLGWGFELLLVSGPQSGPLIFLSATEIPLPPDPMPGPQVPDFTSRFSRKVTLRFENRKTKK